MLNLLREEEIKHMSSFFEKTRVALLVDSLIEWGGAEQVAPILGKILNADIYTSYVNRDILREYSYLAHKCKEIGLFFKHHKLITYSEIWWRFQRLHLPKRYDLYIFYRPFCISAAKKYHPNVWYCNTPYRGTYDLHYFIYRRLNFIEKPIFKTWCKIHKFFDTRAVSQIDKIITISQNVAKRIKKYYKRNASVVYPPVEVSKFYCKDYEDFYLAPGRLVKEKRFDLIIRAFKKLPHKKLVICGSGPEMTNLKKLASKFKNITFLGSVTSDKLRYLYATCTATIYMPINEDLGLVPIESMASGKPCIAANEGGCKETIINGETGFLIKPTVKDLVKHIEMLTPDVARSMKKKCIKRARYFDVKSFVRRFKKELREVL